MPVQVPRRGPSSLVVGGTAAGVVIVVLVVIIVIALTGGGPPPKKQNPVALSAQAIHQTTNVPPAILDQVGTGGNPISSSGASNVVNAVKGKIASSGGVPTVGGKPQFFYYGAEWCPYCATERWSMVIALSRFGTFSGLTGVKSYSSDVYPNTNTFTFYGSHYTSPYIVFDPVEGEDTAKNPLQGTTAWQTKLLNRWDVGPGAPAGAWSFPFIDIAGKYIGGIAQWDNPQLLQNLTWSQIAQTLSEPSNPAGRELDAAANYLTAAICNVTGQQPSSVCTSAGVTAAAKQLANAPAAVPLAGS